MSTRLGLQIKCPKEGEDPSEKLWNGTKPATVLVTEVVRCKGEENEGVLFQ